MNIQLPEGGPILGLGCDIVEVHRIKSAHKRSQEHFLDRIFTEEERVYCLQNRNPYPALAARFAAKEAVAKAFTTGIGDLLEFKSISIYKGESNQPLVRLDSKGQALLQQVGGRRVWITLSHTTTLAQAVAIITA